MVSKYKNWRVLNTLSLIACLIIKVKSCNSSKKLFTLEICLYEWTTRTNFNNLECMVIFLDFYNTKEKEKKKKSTLMERFCTIDYF